MINLQKQQLRKKVRTLKAAFSFEQKKIKSDNIFRQMEHDLAFLKAKVVFAYWSMPDEVNTHAFIKKYSATKTILLPVVAGDNLLLRKFNRMDQMKEEGKYGILEPQGDEFTDFHLIDYIIVPGVAFDKYNNRMGRGKAYYDKLLKDLKAKKVGVCFDFQFFDNVPIDQYDIGMDTIIIDK